MTIGERIQTRRKSLGISAAQLAEAVGVDRSTIFRYENGSIVNVPVNILTPLSNALATTPEYIMGWEYPEASWSEQKEAHYATQAVHALRPRI